MTLAELVTNTRRSLRDMVGTDAERFWQDMDLEEYLNEAQEEMAKRTLCLIESLDPTICTITLLTDTHSYPRNSKIVEIDEIRPSWSSKPLTDAKSFRKFSQGWATRKGLPSQYCCDYSSGYLTLDNNLAVVNGETLSMTVRRLPMLMSSSGLTPQNPEVPEAYQRALRHFACYRALEVRYREVENKGEADTSLQLWEKAINEITSQVAQLHPRIYQARSQF